MRSHLRGNAPIHRPFEQWVCVRNWQRFEWIFAVKAETRLPTPKSVKSLSFVQANAEIRETVWIRKRVVWIEETQSFRYGIN
jgi:hypothetical protein